MRRKINIPVELILNVCKDRQMMELLAFRVYLMLVYYNATIYNVTAEKIQEKFRCDKPTAERLLREAKRSPWFYYNKRRNSLNALSMKSKGVYVASSGNTYRSDFCYCMDKEYISLNEMVRRLRGIVIMMIIAQAHWEPSNGALRETGTYVLIYQATFAKYLGLSCKSVCRLLQHLSSIGWVHKSQQFFYKLKDLKNASQEDVEEYEKKHHNCHLAVRKSSRYYGRTKSVDFNYYKCFGLGYFIDESFSKRFRNIMWTHFKRVNAEKVERNNDKRILVSFPEYYDLLFNPNYPKDYVQTHYRVA